MARDDFNNYENELITNRISSISEDKEDPPFLKLKLKPQKKYILIAIAAIVVTFTLSLSSYFLFKSYKPSHKATAKDEFSIESTVPTMSTTSNNIHIKRGIDSYNKKYYTDAISEFNHVVESNASNTDKAIALTYIGIIADERGEHERAIEFYNRALVFDKNNAEILRNLALAHRHLNQLDKAERNIEQALKIDKHDLDSKILHANILFEQARYKEAISKYEAILNEAPNNAAVMYNMASAFIKTGDEFAAVEYFKKAGTADRIGDVAYKSYSRLGIIFTDRGDFEQAQKYLRMCTLLRPNDAVAKYNLGIAYLRAGKRDLALDQFTQAEGLSNNSHQILEGLGEAFFVMNQHERSINVFEKILLTNKRNVKILSRVGEIYYDKGDLDKAYDAFFKITTIEPATENARVAYLNMGNILDDTGRYEEAIEMYKKALTISPKDDDALYNLGIAYENLGRPELAIKAWRDSLSLKPNNPRAMLAIANYYFKNGFNDLAEKEFQTILARWPELQEGHFKIGSIYYKRNQLDFAFNAFRRSAELDEKNEFGRKSLINMALINSERSTDEETLEESARILKRALILKPNDPNALFAMGIIFSKREFYEAAIDSFYDTIKASNDDKLSAQAYNNIGKCHFKQKEFSRAVQAFTRGIELDSMNEELRINRKAASQAFERVLSEQR